MPESSDSRFDPVAFAVGSYNVTKALTFDVIKELYLGIRSGSLPATICVGIGAFISGFFLFYVDGWLYKIFRRDQLLIPMGHFREWLGLLSVFGGFYLWGVFRYLVRKKMIRKLDQAFLAAGMESALKERPKFYRDSALDEHCRKLIVRSGGIPLSQFIAAKDRLESNLNVTITKMDNPEGNREFVGIIYSTDKMPDFWLLDQINAYKNFSFPIGKSLNGEIVANLENIPHFLVAGESGGGKSTFLRTMLAILLYNNRDRLDVFYLDFKRGMENSVFEGFSNVTLVEDHETAAQQMVKLAQEMDRRMKSFKEIGARSIESFNSSKKRKGPKAKRIIVVVDEVSELMLSFSAKDKNSICVINETMSKVSRMGRAVGISLVIGVQKPDAKNLDVTVKANLSGILCFPVAHFNQSMVVLGNGRAAELNSHYKGRAIWKYGIDQIEVQTPFMNEEEVYAAGEDIKKYWSGAQPKAEASAPTPYTGEGAHPGRSSR